MPMLNDAQGEIAIHNERNSRDQTLVVAAFVVGTAAHLAANVLFLWQVPLFPFRWLLDTVATLGFLGVMLALCVVHRTRVPSLLLLSTGILYLLAQVVDIVSIEGALARLLGFTRTEVGVVIRKSLSDVALGLGFAVLLYLLVKGAEASKHAVRMARNEAVQTAELAAVNREIAERRQIERRLRESEERFRQMADHSRQIFWLVSSDLNTVHYVNPAYEQVMGRSCASLYEHPRSWMDCVHPDDRERVAAAVQERIQGRRTGDTQIEYRVCRNANEVSWVRSVIFPVLDDQGHPYRLAGLTEDVTARKQVEELKNRLQEIIEATPDLVGMADTEGRMLYMNRAGRRMLGFRDDEDVSQVRLAALYRETGGSADERERYNAALRDGVWAGESLLRSRTGSEIPASQVLLAHRSTSGSVEFVSTISRNISERVRAEQVLAEAHNRLEQTVLERTAELARTRRNLELILNSAGEGIFGVDQHGIITFVNPAAARRTGWQPEQLVGRNCHETFAHAPPGSQQADFRKSPIYKAYAQGSVHRGIRGVFATSSGDGFPVQYSSAPIRDGENVLGAVVVFEDIQERLHMEETLRHADRLVSIGTLAAGMAHELKNPLAAIVTFAEAASLQVGNPDAIERVAKCLQEIKQVTGRANRIIGGVLQFARQGPSDRSPQPLRGIVEGAIELTGHAALSKNVSIRLDMPADLPKVVVNSTQMEQVVVNLINNAVQASQGGAEIDVRLRADDDAVRLTVEDQGVGMQPEQMKRMFDPFYTTRKDDEGTGLGLSITHGIVAQHGGTIDVRSSPGSGMTVTITLPRQPFPAEPDDGSLNSS